MGSSPDPAPEAIVENYCAASKSQAGLFNGASMDMEIEASLPKLKKHGRLEALRKISALGRITYEALKFEGDGTVKNYVINKFLSKEASVQNEQAQSFAVTPQNYKFKYKTLTQWNGRDVHIFEISPRKKREGLFQGEVWIDAATYLRVRERGRFVKNPSIVVKRVDFVRNYEIQDGVSVPRSIDSLTETRGFGQVEMTIAYKNVSISNPVSATAVAVAAAQ